MKQEGIFRVNGNAKVMEKLKSEFDRCKYSGLNIDLQTKVTTLFESIS